MIRRTRPLSAALLLVAGACAHAPPVPPPELAGAGGSGCPLPLAWPSLEQTPRRVRVRNATADTVVLVIDRCFHYTALTQLPPGESDQPLLPGRLIAYPDGIRFHAYIQSEARFVGSWHVAPTPGPALDLVLDSATRAEGELFLYDLVSDSTDAPRVIESDQGESYLMLPGVAEGGFLIWSCGGGRRWLSMSTSVKVPGDTTDVAVRFDSGEWSVDERWEVLHSLGDAVLAPEERIDSLTAQAARARLVNVRVVMRRYPPYAGRTFPPNTTTYAFRAEDLAGRLAEVSCFRDLATRLNDGR